MNKPKLPGRLKLTVKIGPHQFMAEGPGELTSARYLEWLAAIDKHDKEPLPKGAVGIAQALREEGAD